MHRLGFTAALLAATSAPALAQDINIWNSHGPSGTHITHELPMSSFAWQGAFDSNLVSTRITFKVWHNSTLKINRTTDYLVPLDPQNHVEVVDTSRWGLAVGHVITYYAKAELLSGPYKGAYDEDYLYGDCVNNISAPPANSSLQAAAPPAAVDDKRRFEDLLG